jgi:hypothetical protein
VIRPCARARTPWAGIGDQHLEACELRIAGIEAAIVVGVEHVRQRSHVVGRSRVPVREHHLVTLRDLPVAVGVEHQHAVASPGPRRAVLAAVARHVEKHVRGAERRDLKAVPVQVEDHGEEGAIGSVAAEVAEGIVVGGRVIVGVRIVVAAAAGGVPAGAECHVAALVRRIRPRQIGHEVAGPAQLRTRYEAYSGDATRRVRYRLEVPGTWIANRPSAPRTRPEGAKLIVEPISLEGVPALGLRQDAFRVRRRVRRSEEVRAIVEGLE